MDQPRTRHPRAWAVKAVAVLALGLLGAAVLSPARPASATTGGSGGGTMAGLVAQQTGDQGALDRLSLQIASLAQQDQAAQAGAVGAELAEEHLEAAVRSLKTKAVAVLSAAYVSDASVEGEVPLPYVQAATRAVDGTVSRYRLALARTKNDGVRARAALTRLNALQAQLATERSRLAAMVGADQARVQRERSAEAAALAAADSARARAERQQAIPVSLAATRAQIQQMARYPFGVLTMSEGQPVLPTRLSVQGPAMSGIASWYGPGFDGQPTATGAVYNEDGWTVASPDLPLGSLLVVQAAGRAVLLLVNDRGPYVAGRFLDLSHAAAVALDSDGLLSVTAQVVAPGPGA